MVAKKPQVLSDVTLIKEDTELVFKSNLKNLNALVLFINCNTTKL